MLLMPRLHPRRRERTPPKTNCTRRPPPPPPRRSVAVRGAAGATRAIAGPSAVLTSRYLRPLGGRVLLAPKIRQLRLHAAHLVAQVGEPRLELVGRYRAGEPPAAP